MPLGTGWVCFNSGGKEIASFKFKSLKKEDQKNFLIIKKKEINPKQAERRR